MSFEEAVRAMMRDGAKVEDVNLYVRMVVSRQPWSAAVKAAQLVDLTLRIDAIAIAMAKEAAELDEVTARTSGPGSLVAFREPSKGVQL